MSKNCVIYCRVSTAKQAQQGESLDEQERACRKIAEERGWQIVPNNQVFREPFSGRKDHRPVLDEIMKYIKDHPGQVDVFIIRVIDRITRGGSLAYETLKSSLARHGVELIDSYGIIQPSQNTLDHLGFEYDWSIFSPSETAEVVMANVGKTEVRNILTRLISREIELTQQGFKIRQPDDGFVNKKLFVEGKKKTIMVPDPKRARFFRKMFELRASGRYSDKEIVEQINALGFKTRIRNKWNQAHDKVIGAIGGNPLTVKRLQEIIKRPVYCGVLCEKWTRYQPVNAQFDGLVSIETFNKANKGKVFIVENSDKSLQILYDNSPIKVSTKHSRNNPLFPYKNVILCPECHKTFMGSSPRGKSGKRFPTYHCARNHRYIGFSKQKFENTIEDYILNLKFTENFLSTFEDAFLDRYRNRQKELAHYSSQVSRNISELEQEKEHAIDLLLKTRSATTRQGIEDRIEKLDMEIAKTHETRFDIEISENDIRTTIGFARFLMEHPERLLINPENKANLHQQQAIFGLLFDELPTFTEIRNGTPKLSLIFELSQQFNKGKSVMVRHSGFQWNTFEKTILEWTQLFERFTFRPSISQYNVD